MKLSRHFTQRLALTPASSSSRALILRLTSQALTTSALLAAATQSSAQGGDYYLANSSLITPINISGSYYATNSNIILASGFVGGSFYTINSNYNQSAGSVMNIGGSFVAENSSLSLNSGSVMNLGGSIHAVNSNINRSSGSVMKIGGSFVAENSNLNLSSGSVMNLGGSFEAVNSNYEQSSGADVNIRGSLHAANSNYYQSSGTVMNIGGSFVAENSNLKLNSGTILNPGGRFDGVNSNLSYNYAGGPPIFDQLSVSFMNIGGSLDLVNSDFEQSTRFVINIGGDLTVSDSNFVVGGILNVNGNYIQRGGSTLTIKSTAGQGGTGILTVGGHAQLEGALQVNIDSAPRPHDNFTILTAAGGVSGEFSSFNNPYPRQPGQLLYFDLNYEGQGVYLEAVQNDFKNALSIFSLTGNQKSTAAALDSALSDPRQDAVLTYLDGFDINAIPGLLDKIAPEELGGIYSIGFDRLNNMVSSLQNRFADIRSSRENAFTAVKYMSAAPSGAKSATETAVLTPPARKRYGFFANGSGDFSSSGNTANAKGYDTESGLFLSGYDALVNDSLTVGVLAGYAQTKSDLNEGGGIDVDGSNLALYAQYARNDWFLESMIGGSYNRYDTDRQALNGTASGDTEGGELDAYLSVGKDLRSDSLIVTPFASLLYTRVGIDAYDESGSLQPLHIENQDADSLRSRIGVRAAQTFVQGGTRITPYASAQWQHEFLDDAPSVNYSFSNGAGGEFTATGPEIGSHSLLLSGGVQVAWGRYACYLSYQADLGHQNYEDQTVLTGFQVTW